MNRTSTTPTELVLVDPAELNLGENLSLKNVRASLEKAGYKPATKRQGTKYIEAGWNQDLPVIILGSGWHGSEFFCLMPPWTYGDTEKLVPTSLVDLDKSVAFKILAWTK